MSTIWEMTYAALTGLGLPLAGDQYLASTPGGNLPDEYITYRVIDLTPIEHADDDETVRDELIQVTIRSRDGLAGLPDVIGTMKTAGFIFAGGREVEFDPEGQHYGIAFDFEYIRDLT